MARTSTEAPAVSRESRVADRNGPSSDSPFRSHHLGRRIVSARAMIEKRQAEIATLTKALDAANSTKIQRILTTRLQAATNNLRSWEAYIAEPEREPRAVVIPTHRSR